MSCADLTLLPNGGGGGPRRAVVDRPQFGQHGELAAHVVRRLDLAAERRAAQHVLALAVAHQVGQVGVAAGELQYADVAGPELALEVRRQLGDIELLAGPDVSGLVFERAHEYLARMRLDT